MEFRILGPLEVLEDGRPLALGRLKERIVLAVLLLHANEFVSRERLIDELWGTSPPATARKAVNVYISKLRQTLTRNGHDPIATVEGGYRLGVDPDLLDAERLRSLIAQARSCIADGDSDAASHGRRRRQRAAAAVPCSPLAARARRRRDPRGICGGGGDSLELGRGDAARRAEQPRPARPAQRQAHCGCTGRGRAWTDRI